MLNYVLSLTTSLLPAPSSGLPSRGLSNGTYEYSRRVFGSVLNDVSRRATREPIPYPSC
jgi:splicing factor 3B subunit 4